MLGWTTSQTMPAHRASRPVMVNINGNVTEGAFAPKSGAVATGRGVGGLTTDMGKETSIGLLFGCRGEAAFFKVRVEMHWAALRAGAEFRARRKCDQGFKNFDHRLGWIESPGVHLHDLRGGRRNSVALANGRRRQRGFRRCCAGLAREQDFPYRK